VDGDLIRIKLRKGDRLIGDPSDPTAILLYDEADGHPAADRPTWDEVLGDMPPWVRRCHLSHRKTLTVEMIQLKRCKIELIDILGALMRKHGQIREDC
jgi:hypothetical protein